MKESQSKKKTSIVTKAIISLGVVLAADIFHILFNWEMECYPGEGSSV